MTLGTFVASTEWARTVRWGYGAILKKSVLTIRAAYVAFGSWLCENEI
jgi:hypothetical protein